MAADETAAKVNVLEVVFFGLEVGDLTDVVTVAQNVSGLQAGGCWLRAKTNLTAYSRLREMS